MASRARGVQLRAASLRVAAVRQIAPALSVGVSVHDAETASEVANDPGRPEWLIAGNVFLTATHPGRPARGVEFIRAVARVGVPVIAIGGVRPEHVNSLRTAGASGVATIRGIWAAPDPVAAAALYL